MDSHLSSAASAACWFHELLDLVGSRPAGRPRLRQCPAHLDHSPSLAIGEGRDGRVLLHCHAGCSTDAVLATLHLSEPHLFRTSGLTPAQHQRLTRLALCFPPIQTHGSAGRGRSRDFRFEAFHDYGGFRLVRSRHPHTGEKEVVWEHRDARGAWIPGTGGMQLADLPLYDERQVRMGVAAGETIVVVESESSVDALTGVGIYATTWAGGASTPNTTRLAAVLRGAKVCVIADHDPPGLECAACIERVLGADEVSVRVVVPQTPGADARDMLQTLGRSALLELVTD